jgi:2-hydroxychromene-2-carboxylate isomerase
MKIVDFYFDFRSPYSYLARSQIGRLGVTVRYRPMDVLAVMKQVGNTPTTVVCASKGKYAGADLARWSKRYGVPIRPRGDMMTIDARRLLRAVLVAEDMGLAQETRSVPSSQRSGPQEHRSAPSMTSGAPSTPPD